MYGCEKRHMYICVCCSIDVERDVYVNMCMRKEIYICYEKRRTYVDVQRDVYIYMCRSIDANRDVYIDVYM